MDRMLLLVLVFLAVAVAVGVVMRLVLPRRSVTERLQPAEASAEAAGEWLPKVAGWLGPAAKLIQPKEDWVKSQMRRKLVNAGYRGDDAPVVYYGAKAVLALLMPLLFFFLLVVEQGRENMALLLVLAAAIGYYLPNAFLILKVRERKRRIFEGFPDALDLMVVCVEAGLGLDAAIAKVGEEIGKSSPELGEEFHLANLELRAGVTREAALRNLALRTGVEDIDALVAMLIQSDKFGTSLADSLRVHADGMRTKRMLRAEENAQKLPVKLVFPVVMFIFPSLFLVLLGPSLLAIAKMFASMG